MRGAKVPPRNRDLHAFFSRATFSVRHTWVSMSDGAGSKRMREDEEEEGEEEEERRRVARTDDASAASESDGQGRKKRGRKSKAVTEAKLKELASALARRCSTDSNSVERYLRTELPPTGAMPSFTTLQRLFERVADAPRDATRLLQWLKTNASLTTSSSRRQGRPGRPPVADSRAAFQELVRAVGEHCEERIDAEALVAEALGHTTERHYTLRSNLEAALEELPQAPRDAAGLQTWLGRFRDPKELRRGLCTCGAPCIGAATMCKSCQKLYSLARNYGLTKEDVDELRWRQTPEGGAHPCCPSCQREFGEDVKEHVDHDHEHLDELLAQSWSRSRGVSLEEGRQRVLDVRAQVDEARLRRRQPAAAPAPAPAPAAAAAAAAAAAQAGRRSDLSTAFRTVFGRDVYERCARESVRCLLCADCNKIEGFLSAIRRGGGSVRATLGFMSRSPTYAFGPPSTGPRAPTAEEEEEEEEEIVFISSSDDNEDSDES